MKSYTSILEETLEEELFMSNLNTLRIEIDKKYVELMQDKAYIVGEVVDSHKGVELC